VARRVSDRQRQGSIWTVATAADAIQRIAEATGSLPATVSRTARALREADARLWPQGAQGRGQAAQVEPRHSVNLVIAIATGFPVDAVANVQRYRTLTAEDGTEFGYYLDSIVERLAHDRDGSVRRGLGADQFLVELMLGEMARAGVRSMGEGDTLSLVVFLPTQDDLVLEQEVAPNAQTRLIPRVTVSLDLLDVLADLWRDTLTYRAIRAVHAKGGTPARFLHSQPDASASAPPENETAATPAREAAALSDQDQTSIPGRYTLEPMQEKESLQGQSSRGPGHSHQPKSGSWTNGRPVI
jgi:hypothetical protein